MKSLENRITFFAAEIISFAKNLPKDRFVIHVEDQLIRAGLSVPLNWGEAQYSESDKDYVHKVSIVLKELHEIKVCLKLVIQLGLKKSNDKTEFLLNENNELLAIMTTCKNKARLKITTKTNKR